MIALGEREERAMAQAVEPDRFAEPKLERRAHPAFRGRSTPAFYTDPLVLKRELNTIFQRTWQYAGHVNDLPTPGSYVTRSRRRPARAGPARRRRRAARLPQRLPPSRLRASHGQRHVQEGDPLPLPRLDLRRHRRAPARRARAPRLRRARQVAARPDPRPGRGARGPPLREPRPRRPRAGGGHRRARPAPRALRAGELARFSSSKGAGTVKDGAGNPAGQLEDHRRELPRGLPRADRASRA